VLACPSSFLCRGWKAPRHSAGQSEAQRDAHRSSIQPVRHATKCQSMVEERGDLQCTVDSQTPALTCGRRHPPLMQSAGTSALAPTPARSVLPNAMCLPSYAGTALPCPSRRTAGGGVTSSLYASCGRWGHIFTLRILKASSQPAFASGVGIGATSSLSATHAGSEGRASYFGRSVPNLSFNSSRSGICRSGSP
jgi:hypothetical protein